MLRVLTLSTLFPDATRPNFGVFVERQTLGLAAHPNVSLQAVAPIGLPPGPFRRLGHYAALAKLPTQERWKGIEVHRPRFIALPFTRGRHHAAALERGLTPLLDTIREDFAFDVIDASFFFPDGPAAVALGKRYGVPVSIKARGADIHHWGNAPATAAHVRNAGRDATGMLAVSAAMKADMVALGLPADRIRVHHTGVDQDRFHPLDRASAKAALGVAGPLVVSVGALIPRKGHDIVIDAVAALPGVTLLIAGEGPERAALRARIARYGIAGRVRLLGAVPHAELPALVAAADVSALASSSEGLANAWVESLSCGTPIVITDAGGAYEVVTSPDAGRVTIRDGLAFAAAIGGLLSDPPAQEATRDAAASFTWDANTAALYEHLAGLVADRR
ncbi:glycosyltransferase [Sphingomonas sp. 4RDLI-65]|uniref:glycosyltransferase n=1 Tax=Sphingomonas sp. 4RDLI-65 TaxID=3111641 RepID=UPI003C20A164